MKTITAAVTAAIIAAAIIFSIVSSSKEMIASAQKAQAQAIAAIDGQKGGAQ
ncbi:MAG: hypothetical protein ABSB95_09180 [Dissulfurispiraceae bacterium]|jgi:hypothetical protein